MKTTLKMSLALLLGLGALAPAQDTFTMTKLSSTDLNVRNWKSVWQPVPEFGYIRTWYDGTGFQVAPSDVTPHNSFGWIEGPVVVVPGPSGSNPEGNLTTLRITYNFTKNYTGVAPEMRVRLMRFDLSEYATASVPANRFNALRATGEGTLEVVFDRRRLPGPTQMFMFIDLIAATSAGNADPTFHFRIKKADLIHWGPTSASPSGNRISASFIENDGDISIFENGSTTRRRIYQGAESYAISGNNVIVIDGGDLSVLRGDNNFNASTIEDNNSVMNAAIEEDHVVYIETDRDVKYKNIRTGEQRQIADDKAYFSVISQGNGSFVIAEAVTSGNGLQLYHFDTNDSSPQMRGLSNDDEAEDVQGSETNLYVGVKSAEQ
jgi:hypothetical protein